MKKLSLLSVPFLFSLFLGAQNVDMKPVFVSFSHLPEEPLPKEFHAYSVKINANPNTLTLLQTNRGKIADFFKLNNFALLPETADFTVNLHIGDLTIWSEKTEKHSSTVKDQAGNEVVKHEYYKQVDYILDLSYDIVDKGGETIRENVPIDHGFLHYRSDAFTNQSLLDKDWGLHREAYIYKDATGVFNKKLAETLKHLKRKIDVYPVLNFEDEIEVAGGKSLEAALSQDAYNTVKAAFALLQPDEPVDDVKRALQPAIEYYTAESGKYSATDKKQYKWLHVCLYNLALIHYWLDDVDEAEKYANECLQVDWSQNRTEKLLKEITALRESLSKTGFKDRHTVLWQQ